MILSSSVWSRLWVRMQVHHQNGFGTFGTSCQCKLENCGCLVPLSALFGLKENEGLLEDNDSGLGDSPPLTPAVLPGKHSVLYWCFLGLLGLLFHCCSLYFIFNINYSNDNRNISFHFT